MFVFSEDEGLKEKRKYKVKNDVIFFLIAWPDNVRL